MAVIKLGILGSEVTLPEMKYFPGGDVEIPTDCSKNVSEEKMLDGSSSFNIDSIHPRAFRLEWDELTWAEVEALQALVDLNVELNYINEFTDSVGYPVVVLTFSGPTPIAETTGQAAILYKFSIELKGTGG